MLNKLNLNAFVVKIFGKKITLEERRINIMNENILNKIIDKVFSGSFSLLVMFGSTYCTVILLCTYLAAKGKIPINEYLILVAGMTGTLTMFWKDYNQIKKDQPTNGGNGNGQKIDNGHSTASASADQQSTGSK